MVNKNTTQGNGGKYLGIAIGFVIATFMTLTSGGFLLENILIIPFYFILFTVLGAVLGKRFLSNYMNKAMNSVSQHPSSAFLTIARIVISFLVGIIGSQLAVRLYIHLIDNDTAQSFFNKATQPDDSLNYGGGFMFLISAVLVMMGSFAVCCGVTFKLLKYWLHPN